MSFRHTGSKRCVSNGIETAKSWIAPELELIYWITASEEDVKKTSVGPVRPQSDARVNVQVRKKCDRTVPVRILALPIAVGGAEPRNGWNYGGAGY